MGRISVGHFEILLPPTLLEPQKKGIVKYVKGNFLPTRVVSQFEITRF